MSAESSRCLISSEPTQTLREVHTQAQHWVRLLLTVQPVHALLDRLGHSSFILSTLSASCSVWKTQNVSVSDTCMLKQTEEAASTFTRGQHNTFNLESFTPDVTSNWFLSHFNITHQNTESSPVRPQKKHIHGFNIKNQQIFSSRWINCKLCVSELLSSCWAKVKKSRSAVTGSDWLSGRGPPCLLTAALEHAGVQSMWRTRPLSPLTSIKNMPKTFCCFCTGISNVLFFFPCPFLYFSLFLLVFFKQRQAC